MRWFGNLIGAAGAVFKRRSAASTANLLELQDETGALTLYIDSTGKRIVGRVGGVDVPLEFVDVFGGELGVRTSGLRLTGGRLDINPAGNSAEVRILGNLTTVLRFFSLSESKSFLDATVSNLTLPGTLTFGNATVQTTATSRNFLTADVVNNSATANTLANVTGLSFPVVAGKRYNFIFTILYDAAATTTGARFTLNGPTFTRLGFDVSVPTVAAASAAAAQALQTSVHNVYDTGPAVGAFSPFTTGNKATISGVIVPSAAGNVIARFASEIASSAITAKAGSNVEFSEV